MRSAWILAAGLAACKNGTATVDEGCRDSLTGEGLLQGSPDVLKRVDCYRGFLGLPPMRVLAGVQAAAEAHAAYLAANDVLGAEPKVEVNDWNDVLSEDASLEGFTGVSPYDRNAATGVTIGGQTPTSVWALFRFDADVDPDVWIQDPFVREPLFQPKILGLGEATVDLGGVSRAYTDVYAAIPSGTRLLRPVVYPKDGQTDVPASWAPLWTTWVDPLSNNKRIGFPVTITMGSDEQATSPFNPFLLKVVSATITDDAGDEVPSSVLTPRGEFVFRLRTTVVVAPRAPLKPDTEYAVDAEIASLFGTTVVHTVFRTSSDAPDTDAPDTDVPDTDAPDTDAP